MKRETMMALLTAVVALALPVSAAHAQITQAESGSAASHRIENLEVAEQGGTVYITVTLDAPPENAPASFSVANPARIAFDFPNTANALGRSRQEVDQGDVRSANIVQAGDRTRLVLNMTRVTPYETRVEGRKVIIALSPAGSGGGNATPAAQALATFAPPAAESDVRGKSVQDIRFRRGEDGEARIVVQMSNPETGINIRQQGSQLVVEFLNASLPEHLQRRSDVTDFGTPVSSMVAQRQGDNVQLAVTPNGLWEHNAYQTDTQFVLEVRRVVEDPSRLVQGAERGEYGGEKLSLNFQDVDIRSVLAVIADFTEFNIVTSDSVQGSLTLRLKDVPWDQALDIILQAKGLDKRKTGNVIWIAPSEELAAREKMQLELLAQQGDLEQLQTENFQINYHRASEIFDFLKSRDQTVLSPRGSVVFDERSNKLFVTDVASRLDEIRRLVREIDIVPRQVLIEARVVEATKDFARDLGVRLNFGKTDRTDFGGARVQPGAFNPTSGQLTNNGISTGGATPAATFGQFNLSLFNSAATRFLSLELAALESDGRGRVVSSPRVLTANLVEATIKQGQEIPYVTPASGTEPPTVSFKDAVLLLKVRPQITPDGKVQMRVEVNKDRADYSRSILGNPPIDTKSIETEVLVENGGTVVIGGVFEEEETTNVDRVPVLGEIPVLGVLFRTNSQISARRELLIFITPRIVTETLTLR